MIPQGQLFTNYFAVINGSLHNYLAMTSGLTAKQSPPQANVFQAIDGTGGSVAWTELEESMTGNCGAGSAGNVPGTTQPLYSRGHDPAYQYRGNSSCSQHDVPLTSATFNPAALPSFSYIVPNECNDMHTLPTSGQACPAFYGSNTATNTVTMGDNWLRTVVPQLLAQPDVTVLITFDEGSSKNEQVLMLELGAGVTAGTNGTAFNHYGLELACTTPSDWEPHPAMVRPQPLSPFHDQPASNEAGLAAELSAGRPPTTRRGFERSGLERV